MLFFLFVLCHIKFISQTKCEMHWYFFKCAVKEGAKQVSMRLKCIKCRFVIQEIITDIYIIPLSSFVALFLYNDFVECVSSAFLRINADLCSAFFFAFIVSVLIYLEYKVIKVK